MNTKNKKVRAKKAIKNIVGHISFSEMLLSLRKSKGMTQVEFAKKLKITKQELCNIEKGRKTVSPERAALFAKKLGDSKKVFITYILEDIAYKSGFIASVKMRARTYKSDSFYLTC